MYRRSKYAAAISPLMVLTLAVSACSSGDDRQSTGGGGGAGAPDIVMARVSGDPFYTTLECAAREEAEKQGVELDVEGMANYEIPEQTRVLNAIIAKRPDVILTAPVDPVGIGPVFQQAAGAGIGLVTFDTRLKDSSSVNSEVFTDNIEQGTLAADALADAIGKKGKVFVLSDMPGISTTGDEQKGFEQKIATYGDIEYLGTQFHNNDQNKAVSDINAMLTANPDLAGIFTTNTFGSQAAATALKQANKAGAVKVIAYDTTQEILDGVKDGTFAAVIAYDAKAEGSQAVAAAVKIAKGEPVEKTYTVKNAVITAENLNELGPQFVYKSSC